MDVLNLDVIAKENEKGLEEKIEDLIAELYLALSMVQDEVPEEDIRDQLESQSGVIQSILEGMK